MGLNLRSLFFMLCYVMLSVIFPTSQLNNKVTSTPIIHEKQSTISKRAIQQEKHLFSKQQTKQQNDTVQQCGPNIPSTSSSSFLFTILIYIIIIIIFVYCPYFLFTGVGLMIMSELAWHKKHFHLFIFLFFLIVLASFFPRERG